MGLEILVKRGPALKIIGRKRGEAAVSGNHPRKRKGQGRKKWGRMSIGGLRGSEIPVETEAIENVEKTRVHGGQKGVGLVE